MVIRLEEMQETVIPHLNQGEGVVSAKMYIDAANKIMISTLPIGASIGIHQHISSSEINYVLSGMGKAICDSVTEEFKKGDCHYCPKGSSHSIINVGTDDLVLLTIVAEQ